MPLCPLEEMSSHDGSCLWWFITFIWPQVLATPDIFLHELSIRCRMHTQCNLWLFSLQPKTLVCYCTDWRQVKKKQVWEKGLRKMLTLPWSLVLVPEVLRNAVLPSVLLSYATSVLFQKIHHTSTPIQFRLALVLATKEFWLRNTYWSTYGIDI